MDGRVMADGSVPTNGIDHKVEHGDDPHQATVNAV